MRPRCAQDDVKTVLRPERKSSAAELFTQTRWQTQTPRWCSRWKWVWSHDSMLASGLSSLWRSHHKLINKFRINTRLQSHSVSYHKLNRQVISQSPGLMSLLHCKTLTPSDGNKHRRVKLFLLFPEQILSYFSSIFLESLAVTLEHCFWCFKQIIKEFIDQNEVIWFKMKNEFLTLETVFY